MKEFDYRDVMAPGRGMHPVGNESYVFSTQTAEDAMVVHDLLRPWLVNGHFTTLTVEEYAGRFDGRHVWDYRVIALREERRTGDRRNMKTSDRRVR